MALIKTKDEIEILREGGKILRDVLEYLRKKAEKGMNTKVLEVYAEEMLKQKNAKGSFLGYRGFPSVLCASINDMVVHAVPSETVVLKEGDILSLDLGVLYKGLYTDAALTIAIGSISKEAERLVAVTKKSLELGIKSVKDGNTTGDIGHTIQKYVEGEGFAIVRELVGHGVGHAVHEAPSIPNHGNAGQGAVLRKGMVIAIEPMITTGGWEVEKEKNGFGYKTRDGSLAAHFEHTVAVTERGCEVLTA